MPARRYSPLPLTILAGGIVLQAIFLQSVLENTSLASQWFSLRTWQSIAATLGGHVEIIAGDPNVRRSTSFLGLLGLFTLLSAITWPLGAAWIRRRHGGGWRNALYGCARSGWAWWWLPGGWELVRVLAVLAEWEPVKLLMNGTVSLVAALSMAGWLATLVSPAGSRPTPRLDATPPTISGPGRRAWACVLLAAIAYTLVFTTMNWDRYHNLLIPHGDSAMYEEHLWNTWHGKGFRSYLDDGRLFLGEHFQVIHLLLSPLYWLWSSHLLLELCESAALAIGSLAVFRLARRQTGRDSLAIGLAVAYLLAFPVHFLDIDIQGKTFRPIVLGVPLLLWALDSWESGARRRAAVLLVLTMAAKEDYCLVIIPLGLWLAIHGGRSDEPRRERTWGLAVATAATAWLLLVLLVLIPAFRGGAPHFAQYFGKLGQSPGEILDTAVSQPLLLLGKWCSPRSAFYALALLLPIGFLPLLARGRLAVGLPVFAMLCLLELSQGKDGSTQTVVPFFHFHAPLIPVLYWAAAHGLGELSRARAAAANRGVSLAVAAALCTGVFYSTGPLGFAFWDVHSDHHGPTLHDTSRRAKLFEQVEGTIPITARVFSTDFVHPRFTHHERSYDYSGYIRDSDGELTSPVAGEEYYIVIDTQHRYSEIKTPGQIPQLRDHPDEWQIEQLVKDDEGTIYFIVLKRKSHP